MFSVMLKDMWRVEVIRLIIVLGGKEHGVNRRPLSLENWKVVSLVYCPTIWLFRYH